MMLKIQEVANSVKYCLKKDKKTLRKYLLYLLVSKVMEYSDGLEGRVEGEVYHGEVNVRWGIQKKSISSQEIGMVPVQRGRI